MTDAGRLFEPPEDKAALDTRVRAFLLAEVDRRDKAVDSARDKLREAEARLDDFDRGRRMEAAVEAQWAEESPATVTLTCANCEGTGVVNGKPCPACDGKGWSYGEPDADTPHEGPPVLAIDGEVVDLETGEMHGTFIDTENEQNERESLGSFADGPMAEAALVDDDAGYDGDE